MRKFRTVLVSVAALLALAVCAPRAGAEAAPPAGAADALTIDEALRGLDSSEWIFQAEAMSVLARARAPQAVAPLKAILAGQGNPWVRGRALVALAGILGGGALNDALAMAGHAAPELREAAMEALGAIGSPRGLPAVEAHLSDAAPSVRNQAIVSLARLERQKAWDRVGPLLADADPAAVSHAARAAVYVATPEARKALIGLLSHAAGTVRLAAVRALGELHDPDAIPMLLKRMHSDSTEGVRPAAEKALLGYDPQVLAKPLVAALDLKESGVHTCALAILKARPSREASDGVAAYLAAGRADKGSHDILIAAMEVAAGTDPGRHQAIFVKYLDHTMRVVRQKAVEIIARCPGADLFGLLKARLAEEEPDDTVRVAAIRALRTATRGAPPGGIVEYLAPVLVKPKGDAFEAAAALLSERLAAADVPKALAALGPALGGADERVRQLAADALQRFDDAGLRRKVAAAQGYLTQWSVIGPFPSDVDNHGFTAVYPPEVDADLAKPCEAYPFGQGAAFRVLTAACNGATKQALSVRPPEGEGVSGRTIVTYLLDLPQAADLELAMFLGIQDGAPEGDGARVEAAVDGRKVMEHKVVAGEGWTRAEADLSALAGRRVRLDLTVDALEKAAGDWVVVGGPRVVSGGKEVADLVELAPAATARIALGDTRPPRLAWESVRSLSSSGRVDLHEAVTKDDFCVAYAAADVESPDDRKACLTVAADDGMKAWVNGVKVGERSSGGLARFTVDLKKGRNRIALKVCNEYEQWGFSVRVTDGEDRRIEVLTPIP